MLDPQKFNITNKGKNVVSIVKGKGGLPYA